MLAERAVVRISMVVITTGHWARWSFGAKALQN